MSAVRIVTQEEAPPASVTTGHTSATGVWIYIVTTMALIAVIGTWLVVAEMADRFFGTAVIQRGGMRR